MKQVNKLFKRFEPLVRQYVEKIEILDRSIELADIEQELKIKLYTSIIAYGKKWAYYRKTNKLKPVPIEYYLRTVLNHKMFDFHRQSNMKTKDRQVCCSWCGSSNVKKIGVLRFENKVKQFQYNCLNCKTTFIPEINRNEELSKEADSVDVGMNYIDSEIDFLHKRVVIDSLDFLKGMSTHEKAAMCMFFKGFPKMKIAKVFKRHFEGGYNEVINFIEEMVEAYKTDPRVLAVRDTVLSNELYYSYSLETED